MGALLTTAFLGGAAHAQAPAPAAPAGTDTLYISTTVGSFKILPAGPDTTRGALDIEFEGTVMVSGLNGTVTPGTGVRLELDRPEHKRQVYFGKGRIRVDGEFRAIQFFGRNLKGTFRGNGVARLYGEFDKNMETGYYWYASNPQKQDWGAYGRTVIVPAPLNAAGPMKVKGKVKDVPRKGGF